MNTGQLETIQHIARGIRRGKEALGYSWEDLAQDVAIRAWLAASTIRGDNWRAWVSAIARQRNQERFRRETVRIRETQARASEHSATSHTPAKIAETRELLNMPRRKARRAMGW